MDPLDALVKVAQHPWFYRVASLVGLYLILFGDPR